MSIDRTLHSKTGEGAEHREIRTQFGALCFRRKAGEVEVLLITSRETQRWVLPKGWPMPGKSPVQAAEQEAWEEAGVKGKVCDRSLGLYSYTKLVDSAVGLPCVVALFPLKVRSLSDRFPERRERRRKWFPLKKAASKVDEPELSQLLLAFDPVDHFD
jgi:8-oxo-dGTP pyrophosphatase MutT (NUDIX family)